MKYIAVEWKHLFDEDGVPLNELVFPALYQQMMRVDPDIHLTLVVPEDVTIKQIQFEHSDMAFRDSIQRKLNNPALVLPYEVYLHYLKVLDMIPLSGQVRVGVSTPARRYLSLKWLKNQVSEAGRYGIKEIN